MTETDALQLTLAAEHAAVSVFATFLGRLPAGSPLAGAVSAAYAEHRSRRDDLTARLRDAGEEPVVAAPAYRLPARLRTVAGVRVAAQRAERAASQAYAALVAETTADDRSWAVSALTASALRALTLGDRPAAFPGAAELG